MKIGDKVAFSKQWLQSTSQYAGDIPHARGKITELVNITDELIVATVAWDKFDIPAKVNIKNLVLVERLPYDE
jgi:hypothetical protein